MKASLFVALCCVLLSIGKAADTTTMSVAIVEGEPTKTPDTDKTLLKTNADNYMNLIYPKDSKGTYDIIVFPEYGLTGMNFDGDIAVTINDTKVSGTKDDNLGHLDEIAKNHGVLLVANVLEKDGDDLYSTTVVLDGKDAILAKYRKTNINETETKLHSDNQIATFETDFGVFALISGDDILYESPIKELLGLGNVTTFIYTSSLKSVAPFRTAISLHAGFAKAHNVNLLVASLNDPANGISGSGMYEPCKTVKYYIYATAGTNVITADVDIKPGDCKPSSSTDRRLFGTSLGTDKKLQDLLIYNYEGLTTEIINQDAEAREVCDGSFCCKFNITSKSWNKTEVYRLVVSGGDEKVCGLISCTDDKKIENCAQTIAKLDTSFDKIEIGTSEGDAPFMPYILHPDLTPKTDMNGVKFTEKSEDGTTFSVSGAKDTVALGIVSAKSSANSLQILTTNILLFSILLKYLQWVIKLLEPQCEIGNFGFYAN